MSCILLGKDSLVRYDFKQFLLCVVFLFSEAQNKNLIYPSIHHMEIPMATIFTASNIFALIYIELAQFLNCGIRTTHSLKLDYPKVDLKSNCISLFFFNWRLMHLFVYSMIITENEIIHVKMFWKLSNKNPYKYKLSLCFGGVMTW